MKKPKKNETGQTPTEIDTEASMPVENEPAPEETPAEAHEKTVAVLEEKIAELTDQWLRAVADLDNFRKRAAKERRRDLFQAQAGTIRPILEIVDDFDRALSLEGEENDLRRGVQMIYDKFQHTLASLGIEAFSAVGQMFDPNSMEALTTLSVPGKPENEVIGEIRKGYRYHGELLRTAQVTVNQPAAEEPAETK